MYCSRDCSFLQSAYYCILSHSKPASFLFEPSLIQLAINLLQYKKLHPGPKESSFRGPLLPCFEEHAKKPKDKLEFCQSFDWTGPVFLIIRTPMNLEEHMAVDVGRSDVSGQNSSSRGNGMDIDTEVVGPSEYNRKRLTSQGDIISCLDLMVDFY
jgi:hypothetical protein